MKAQIERDDFLKILTPSQNLVEKRNVIPILSKALLQVEKEQLKIFVTDQENSLQSSFPVQKSKEGATCVDAQNLFSIVKELAPGTIFLEKPEKKEGLKIKTKNSAFNMVGTQPEDFPIFPHLQNPSFFSIKASQLASLIDQTTYCVSMDETRYHLNGVLCEKRGDTLRFVATDGHRLSFADAEKVGDFDIPEGVIIPRKGLNEVSRLLSGEERDVRVAIHPPRALIQCGCFLLSIRLIEGKYPNYHQLIPKSSKIKMTVHKETLTQALRRVSILSSLQSRNVHFQWENKKLILTAKHPDLGDAKEEIPLKQSQGSLAIRFNARYVLEALNHIKEEDVIWEMNTSKSPGIVRTSAFKGSCVIMPMKL